MRLLKNLLICFLIAVTLNLSLSNTIIAQQYLAKEEAPEHYPQIWSTPEIKIPPMETKKKVSWYWWLIGIVVVAGGAASLSGGPEESGNGSDDTGSIIITGPAP